MRILGISIARDAQNARAHIATYANAWLGGQTLEESRIDVADDFRLQYGVYGEDVQQTIREMMLLHGVPMDGTYTAKAFTGLKAIARRENWHNQRVLFIHTGGTPLYFDFLRA